MTRFVIFLIFLMTTFGCSNTDFSSTGKSEGSSSDPVIEPSPSPQEGDQIVNSNPNGGILIEDGIAGQAVTKFGIGFEDRPSGPDNWQDVIVCFKGGFKLDNRTLRSTRKQTVQITALSQAGCTHDIGVRVLDSNKNELQSFVVNGKPISTVNASLDVTNELDVYIIPRPGTAKCALGQRIDLTSDMSRITADSCYPGVDY